MLKTRASQRRADGLMPSAIRIGPTTGTRKVLVRHDRLALFERAPEASNHLRTSHAQCHSRRAATDDDHPTVDAFRDRSRRECRHAAEKRHRQHTNQEGPHTSRT